MRPLSLDQKTKGWMIGSILVLLINLVVFAFRNHLEMNIVLSVVVLTPIAWLLLYVLLMHVLPKR